MTAYSSFFTRVFLPAFFCCGVRFSAADVTWEQVGSIEIHLRKAPLEMLYAEKFEELDKLAAKFHDPSERVPGGVWKLMHFSNSVCYPKDTRSNEEWNLVLEKLTKWNEKSATAFTLNALGHCQLNRGWNIRGYGFAGKVEAEKWGPFSDWVEKAAVNLEAAVEKDPGCVDAYKSLLHLGITQGWPMEKMQEMFDRAVKVAPDYYYYYYNMAFYKMERWYGKPGEWQQFLNTIPERIPGDKGLEIYTRTALQLFRHYKDDFFGEGDKKVHWDRAKKGFEVMLKTYPNIFNQNKYAMLALNAQDWPTAKSVLSSLHEKGEFFVDAWPTAAEMQKAKNWLAEAKAAEK